MTSTPEPGWQPRAYLWEGGWIAISKASTVFPTHSHHVVQFILSLDVVMRIHGGDGDWRSVRGAIVQADAPHSLDPCGAVVVFLYVDPESREGRWLSSSLTAPITPVAPEQFQSILPQLELFRERLPSASEMTELVLSLVGAFCEGPPPTRGIDERVSRVLALIREHDAPRIPLEETPCSTSAGAARCQRPHTSAVSPMRRT